MKGFERILIPVDFSINTEVALKKAVELTTSGLTVIYLLHVDVQKKIIAKNGMNNHKQGESTKNIALSMLTELKNSLQQKNENIQIELIITDKEKVEHAIVSAAEKVNPDLIIIGKKNHHSFFPFLNTVISANIAEETKCAVLTVKPGSINKKMETVVMPVSDLFPKKKIDILAALSVRMNLNVHLLTILESNQHPDNHSASALLQSMKLIKSRLKCNVQHYTIHSNNKAIATLRYAERVNADILLVNPEAEATITTWISKKDITDIVDPTSQLQVLSVQPN